MMKTYAVLGIIIALVVSIAAVGCTSSKSTKHKATPTATPTTVVSTPTSEPTSEPTETQETNEAATATSLDFTVQVDTQGVVYTYRYRAKNIGTSSLDFRYDMNYEMNSEPVTLAYILKGSTRQGWMYSGTEWTEFTDLFPNFDDFWNAYYEGFESYHNYLAEEWNGLQGWTYTVPGAGTVTYTNIEINPALPDSIFQPD